MEFLSYLISGISLGSIYAIIALGYTMVYGIAKMLNFAHGDVIMIGAYISFCATQYWGLPPAVSVLAAMVVCTVLGVVIEGLAYKPLRQASSLAVLLTAIGMSYLLQNIALLVWGANPKSFVAKYQELYGEVPNQFAADAYDGIYALYAAAVAGGITADTSVEDACEILIEQFQQLTVEGLTGTMTWSATGEVTKTPTAVVIKDGVYVGAGK